MHATIDRGSLCLRFLTRNKNNGWIEVNLLSVHVGQHIRLT